MIRGPACYLDPHPEKIKLMQAFAVGCGGQIVTSRWPIEAEDHAVVAKGVALELVPKFFKESIGFWYIDSAYIQLPGQRYSRIERSAYWPNPPLSYGYSIDRAHELGVRLKPWRKTGSHVLLCLPGPMAGSDFHGTDHMPRWWDAIRKQLEASTDRKIRVRHKKARETRPLAADLEDAWCVVTHSSTAGVEAVIEGIPVFCAAGCAAAAVGGLANPEYPIDIENPATPSDREEWIAALAWRQFSREELRSGFAWDNVKGRQWQ